MKLAELKAAVYQLAQVSTTKQLKAQHKAIKPLDLRYKASWEKALTHLRSGESTSETEAQNAKAASTKKGKPQEKKNKAKAKKRKTRTKASQPKDKKETTQKDTDTTPVESFKDWLSNPPGELGDLFAAADTALESFGEKLEKGKQMTKQAIAMTSSLDEFAEATVDEAKRLAKAAQQAMDRSKEADLN